MTKVAGIKYPEVGNYYGLRTWVEYGLKQSKNELGWVDFRVTKYTEIEKWWEVVMSAYLLISLASEVFQPTEGCLFLSTNSVVNRFPLHRQWDQGKGWKNLLNNFRLILQPFSCFNRLKDWLTILPIPQLSLGFPRLIALMNFFTHPLSELMFQENFYYSSASTDKRGIIRQKFTTREFQTLAMS